MVECSGHLFTVGKVHRNFGRRGRRHSLSHEDVNQVRRGIQHSPLQLDGIILGRHVRQIARWRMTTRTMPVTVKERSATLRVPGDHIADLVRKAIRNVGCARMQERRNIGDLLRCKGRESGHASIQPPVPNHRTDHVTLVVVQHQRGAN